MNLIRRHVVILAGLAVSMLAVGSVPAFAERLPPDGVPAQLRMVPKSTAPIHLVASGGMPGWQITLIAVGAAVLAATLAVRLDRLRHDRHHQSPHAA